MGNKAYDYWKKEDRNTLTGGLWGDGRSEVSNKKLCDDCG